MKTLPLTKGMIVLEAHGRRGIAGEDQPNLAVLDKEGSSQSFEAPEEKQ